MRVYYFDDSGDRSANPDRPYLVLGGFGIDSHMVPRLRKVVVETAEKYGLHLGYPQELKFNQVGRNKDNKSNKPHWMIRAGLETMEERRALVYSCLRNALQVESVRVISVAVDQREYLREQKPIEAAITPLLERVQMDCQLSSAQAMVLMDEEQADDKALRGVMRRGSEFLKYSRLLDTISFMPSEESPGIQIADLVAGSVGRYLNFQDPGYFRTFWKSVAVHRGRRDGAGFKIYPRGTSIAPANRTAPWSELDRDVHDIEFRRTSPDTNLQWIEDGTPTRIWTGDADTSSDGQAV